MIHRGSTIDSAFPTFFLGVHDSGVPRPETLRDPDSVLLFRRLFVTPEGFDERLAMAAQKLVALDAPFRLAWPSHRMSPAGTAPDRPVQPGNSTSAVSSSPAFTAHVASYYRP